MSFTTTIGTGPSPARSSWMRALPRSGAYGESRTPLNLPHLVASQLGSCCAVSAVWISSEHDRHWIDDLLSSSGGTSLGATVCVLDASPPSLVMISGRFDG